MAGIRQKGPDGKGQRSVYDQILYNNRALEIFLLIKTILSPNGIAALRHLSADAQDFVIYANEKSHSFHAALNWYEAQCEDETTEILDRLCQLGFVRKSSGEYGHKVGQRIDTRAQLTLYKMEKVSPLLLLIDILKPVAVSNPIFINLLSGLEFGDLIEMVKKISNGHDIKREFEQYHLDRTVLDELCDFLTNIFRFLCIAAPNGLNNSHHSDPTDDDYLISVRDSLHYIAETLEA